MSMPGQEISEPPGGNPVWHRLLPKPQASNPALTRIGLSSVPLSERRADTTGDTHGTVRACTLCQG